MKDNKTKSEKKKVAADKARKIKEESAVYAAEERAVMILDILKEYSDENHAISQTDILNIIFDSNGDYCMDPKLASRSSRNTLHKTLIRVLSQVNPLFYDDNDEEYLIKYTGYKDDDEPKSIKNLQYEHAFSNSELDQLMHAVSFDRGLSLSDKQQLMRKIQKTASKFYESPMFNKNTGKVKFYDYGIYSRLDSKEFLNIEQSNPIMYKKMQDGKYPKGYSELPQSIQVIQAAINQGAKISFMMNGYNGDHQLEQRPIRSKDGRYTVSPYYIVVYQEFYYLIGAFDEPQSPNIYRIDLMTDVEILKDDKGKVVKALPVRNVPGLPSREKWNPEVFMREHLYMFYGVPRSVTLRVKKNDYTFIHDWFGDTYSRKRRDSGKEGYELVEVRCTTDAMVHFALQWSERVEVMDDDIRQLIKEKLRNLLEEKYNY